MQSAEDVCARIRYQGQGQALTSHSIWSVACDYLPLLLIPASGTQVRNSSNRIHCLVHYSGVILGAMASRITHIYSTVCSGTDQRIHQSYATGLSEGNLPVIGEFPSQRASNAECFSIWWGHHVVQERNITSWYSHQTHSVWLSMLWLSPVSAWLMISQDLRSGKPHSTQVYIIEEKTRTKILILRNLSWSIGIIIFMRRLRS